MINLENYASINAAHQYDDLSNKYKFVPTTQVINVLESAGWNPVKVQEMRCNKEDRKGFQKHLIRFRQSSAPVEIRKDQIFPEIVLTNSHDGLSSFQLMAGLYRVICSNGLTVADSTFQTHRIRHMGYADSYVHDAIEDILQTVPKITAKVEDFSTIELTPNEQGIYAVAALTAKYGEDDIKNREFDVKRLLAPYRSNDSGNELWKVYNRVQEKLVNGGRYERKTDKYGYKRTGRAKAINSISENIRVNQALWLLTEEMAKLKN